MELYWKQNLGIRKANIIYLKQLSFMKRTITKQRIAKYLRITEKALKSIEINKEERIKAEEILKMANSYFLDANHFFEKEKYVDAFACVNYAHGWLDAGARIGLLKVIKNKELFTID